MVTISGIFWSGSEHLEAALSALGQLLWFLITHHLLKQNKKKALCLTAYADDFAVIVEGHID